MEARKAYRLSLNSEVLVQNSGHHIQAAAFNVGLNGILIDSPESIEAGKLIFIEFRLTPSPTLLKVWSKVVWCEEKTSGRYWLGLEFHELESSKYTKLADYISERWYKEIIGSGE